MEIAKVSEIFLSYQGEGTYAGSKQLFVRFFGCNMKCSFCDTKLADYKSFTKESLLSRVLDFGEEYNEIVLTGGEPLLFSDFLVSFISMYKKHFNHKIYLETNGTLPEELKKVIKYVDIISMDIKMPSSTNDPMEVWGKHKEFIDIAGEKELIVKAVVTGCTTIDDIKKMGVIIKGTSNDATVVLQSAYVSEKDNFTEADEEMMMFFREYLKKETGKNILVLGQIHKYLSLK